MSAVARKARIMALFAEIADLLVVDDEPAVRQEAKPIVITEVDRARAKRLLKRARDGR